ncbi:MAG: type VI secretion system contractile sheath large subunit [bacterium]|nr:type VI secretion system contractile sheath large subunit [bacterium]
MANETAVKVEEKHNIDWLLNSINIEAKTIPSEDIEITSLSEFSPLIQNDDARMYGALSLLMANYELEPSKGFNKSMTQKLINKIDSIINDQINEIVHEESFKKLESNWLGIEDLVKSTNFQSNIKIDLIDVTKDELEIDFECNSVDITGSELFKKIYYSEYDQFGGEPYGSLIGLYDFDRTPEDIDFLSTVGKISTASHAPFVGNVSPAFFSLENASDIENIKDIEGMIKHPKYRRWNKFRDTEEATYVGLTLPRYIIREPWDPDLNPAGKQLRGFKEKVNELNDNHYLWASSSILFARNLTRSFESSGWCQYIRGPKGGGLIEELPTHVFNVRGKEEIKPPVECVLPDNKELALARSGLIPLIYEKGTSNACFFSAQSLKKPKEFQDPRDTEDSQMVTNLSYTYSVCRIAHYIKAIGRLNIGSSADGNYLQNILDGWIQKYVTIVADPDDLTLRYFPFKAAEVVVNNQEGNLGWYNCTFSVLPHIQFEGMDVNLQLTTRLE